MYKGDGSFKTDLVINGEKAHLEDSLFYLIEHEKECASIYNQCVSGYNDAVNLGGNADKARKKCIEAKMNLENSRRDLGVYVKNLINLAEQGE